MSRVELAIPERDVVPVTEALADSGVFHMAPTDHMCPEDATCDTNEWQAWSIEYSELEQRILGVMTALGVDPGPVPEETPHLVAPEVARLDIGHLEQEARAPVHELEEEQRKLARLERYLGQLEPLVGLGVDLGALRSLQYAFAMLGTIPTANIERLESSLEHVPSVLVRLASDLHLTTVVLFGMRRDREILTRAARSAYLNPLTPPETYRGTPQEVLTGLQAGIQRTRQHIADYQSAIDHLRQARIAHLRHVLWRVRASRKLSETISGYARLRYTYLVAGWVPAPQVEGLKVRLNTVSGRVLVEVNEPRRDEAGIPVALENPPIIRAFQGLVTNYGQPRYGELDPTPLLALTFPIVFGVMFGDVGHGLLLLLAGIVVAGRRVPQLRSLGGIGPVFALCGLASMLAGFLYGSLFGFDGIMRPLWLNPIEDITGILTASVGIGASLLSLGMVYGIANSVLERQWGHALFGHSSLAGLIFYWSLIGLVASLVLPGLRGAWPALAIALVVSGVAVGLADLLTNVVEGRRPLVEGSLGTALIQGAFQVFELLIGLLSNTLSYVRMGAFAVAHGALMMVVFIIANRVGPTRGLLYWFVIAAGNLAVIGFEGLIVGIQTLRLEYYEFFSKFFTGSGIRHSPLTLVRRNEG
jgi:V/A-type H+-transporting ATPase subunit I